jgi:hypothetical protein
MKFYSLDNPLLMGDPNGPRAIIGLQMLPSAEGKNTFE